MRVVNWTNYHYLIPNEILPELKFELRKSVFSDQIFIILECGMSKITEWSNGWENLEEPFESPKWDRMIEELRENEKINQVIKMVI